MVTSVNDARDEFTATAGQTVFSYTFKIFSNTDLNVYVTPSGATADDTTDLTTSYTVTGVGDAAGGTITLTTPSSSSDLITIVSNIPSSRTTDYQNNGDFIPDTVNDDFDRVLSIVKKIEDTTNRAVVTEQSQQGPKPLSLPRPVASKLLRWNGSETGLDNVDIADISPKTIIAQDLIISRDSVAAMVADTTLVVGMQVVTKGYYTPNDGGGTQYLIVAGGTGTDDGGSYHDLDGGQQAELKFTAETGCRVFGAIESTADNSTAIKACYDYCALAGSEFVFDGLFPTTGTVDFSTVAMTVRGIFRGIWKDADVGKATSGILYTGLSDAVTCGNGSQLWENFKVRSTDQLNTNGIHFNGTAATLMTLRDLRVQNNGGAGILCDGNNSGESFEITRVESSENLGSGLFVNRTDTSCNNMTLNKCNFHRNTLDGCNFASGVQRLTVTDGCDFTLNERAGIAFRALVDFESLISNNWFENNDTDILLDCDTPFRGVTSKNNRLAEATTQSVYCQNGRIKSFGDKLDTTPIGFRFDVDDGTSTVALGSAEGVTTVYSGSTDRLIHKPFQESNIVKYNFVIEDVLANLTNQTIPIQGIAGHVIQRIQAKDLFYRIRAKIDGVTVTAGSMTISIVKNTATNVHTKLVALIDSSVTDFVEDIELFGDNTFSSSNNFTNFFLVYTTTADWDGITGFVDVDVFTLENIH